MLENISVKESDFNLCVQCGKCASACPLFAKSKLNPRKILLEIARLSASLTTYPSINIREKNEVWDCTSCSTCSFRCPREAKPMDVIIALRAFFLENGQVPRILADVLEGVFKYGNPWGLGRDKRTNWAEGLNVRIASKITKNDLLYFVGCAPSYDSRLQNVAKAVVKTLNKLNVDFSILGNEETCCGNEIYHLGEKGLFEELRDYTLSLLDLYKVQEIITTSPHCYNIFKNKYGKKIQVEHCTQRFADLIDSGAIKFSRKIEKLVTYHDPCFLGKHNNIYDEPRKIIENIPGVKFYEFSFSRKRSICCEGGGGRMWYDIPGERLAEKRVADAIDIGAEVIAVACPFCLLTFEDAIKTTGNEEKIQVKDVTELLAEAL